MSEYYKPHRKPDWNYGGPNWRLSRSKIDLFMSCPRCFYIDNKLGTARAPHPSNLTKNSSTQPKIFFFLSRPRFFFISKQVFSPRPPVFSFKPNPQNGKTDLG